MKKKIAFGLALTLALSAAVGLTACAAERTDPVNPGDTLVVGVTYYAPMNYFDENNTFVGFDTEFAQKALKELGYGIKFQEINWENKINELKSGKIDLIWNGMTITDSLKQSIAITDSYLENKQVVVAKAEDAEKYTDIASIASAKSIAVESGSAGETVLTENGYAEKLTKLEAQSDCLMEVKAGTSEIAVIDITMAKSMTGADTDYSDLTFVDVGFASEEYGIGLRKADTALLEALNGIIARYKADGTFDALVEKYMV